MLKLKQKNIDESISIKDMRIGQIGIITECLTDPNQEGRVVKRFSAGLFSLDTDDTYWIESSLHLAGSNKFRVKILPNGTELIICNNE